MVALLIVLTGFFVATEFAIIRIRSSRVDQLVSEGNKNAIAAKHVISNLDEYLSACQLGITVTALGLGWIGESTIEHLLHPVFEALDITPAASGILSIIIALSIMTFLHVVIGELAPKTIAIQKAERVTLLFAKPIIFFYKLMYPFIKTLNGSARFITGLFGLKLASEHEVAHSEEELRLILSESYKNGEINSSEYKYMNNIFQFDDRIAKEIMIPRTELIAFSKDMPLVECIRLASEENYTRYPIYDGDKDHIIGMVNMKEVLTDYIKGKKQEVAIQHYLRPVIQVIESVSLQDLLVKMQKDRVHMAILIDEYGGTGGLVTVEDILEEIVGDIRDEFDYDESPDIRKIDNNKTILDGKVLVEEVNSLFGLNIDDTDIDTIGGWILSEKMDVQKGDVLSVDDFDFHIVEVEGFHIKKIKVEKSFIQRSPA
ncbi:HlyC/CorC family transporter [Bacillus sp. RD4P76]|uniref:HlyC/CorC family transporter n=2 Tax=Bacillus suaedaesalsae TaxID=2810349 RepID=A0ABS2DGX8_9BACI|nr:HlyC/CorC family transporter [Bacillus suaedaesalsae]